MKTKVILTALLSAIALTGCANHNATKQASERNDSLKTSIEQCGNLTIML